jgi:hypothetical protein
MAKDMSGTGGISETFSTVLNPKGMPFDIFVHYFSTNVRYTRYFHSQAHNTVLNSLPILQPHPVQYAIEEKDWSTITH